MNRRQAVLGTFLLITLISLGGVLLSGSGQKPELTIRIAMLGSSEDEDYDGAMAFKSHVETATSNRLKVELYPSGQFCSTERECLEGLQSGVLQVFMFTTGGFGSVFGPAQVLDLPYTFENDAVAECVLDGPMLTDLGKAILEADLGIRFMTTSNTGGWRNFATTDSPIFSPEDVRGLKIRTITASLQQELVKQLGGNPTPISWPEVYTALATGVVDGTKNGIHDIVSMQLHEQIRFVTLDGHAYMGGLWWYSEASWLALSDKDKKVVQEAFLKLKWTTRESIRKWEEDSYAAFEDSGGTLISLDDDAKDRFRQSAGRMREWYQRTYGDSWLVALDDAVNNCE